MSQEFFYLDDFRITLPLLWPDGTDIVVRVVSPGGATFDAWSRQGNIRNLSRREGRVVVHCDSHRLNPGPLSVMVSMRRPVADGEANADGNIRTVRTFDPHITLVTRRTDIDASGERPEKALYVIVEDRGPWEEGADYGCMVATPDDAVVRTDEVWMHSSKWRCLESHRASADNAPGYGHEQYWEWVASTQPEDMQVVFVEDDNCVLPGDPAGVQLTLKVFWHGQDVTEFIEDSDVTWSRESETAAGEPRTALDEEWNGNATSLGKEVILTESDFQTEQSGYTEGVGKLAFTAEVVLRNPATGRAVSRSRASTDLS